jgi:hypothetical protein
MPSSAVRTFTDPDEYAASIRGGEVELTVAARGDFRAKLIRIDLHCLWMQRFADNLPRIIHSAHIPGRASVKSPREQFGARAARDSHAPLS